MPDARNLRGLLDDELVQRQQSGHAVNDRLTKQIRAAVSDETAASLEIAELYDQLDHTTLRADWDHDETSALEDILAAAPDAPSAAAVPGQDELADRILAAWLGRCAGCNLGKPVEGWGWNRAKLRDYLHEAGAFPLDGYLPVLDPMPERFTLNPCWTGRDPRPGRCHGAPGWYRPPPAGVAHPGHDDARRLCTRAGRCPAV